MKKFLAAAAFAALTLSMTACGCSSSTNVTPSVDPSSSAMESTPTTDQAIESQGLNIGLGFAASTAESEAATADTNGKARFNVTVCALCVDDRDRIVDVRFDSVESDVGFDLSGAFTGDIESDILTKREMGDDYAMGAVSSIGKNWYEQMDAFEEWLRGKTVSEAMGMSLYYDGEDQIPDEEDLKTSVTISVTDQLKALEKAYADATGSMTDDTANGTTDSYTDESSSEDSMMTEESSSSMAQ